MMHYAKLSTHRHLEHEHQLFLAQGSLQSTCDHSKPPCTTSSNFLDISITHKIFIEDKAHFALSIF